MAIQTFVNGESGLSVLNKINGNAEILDGRTLVSVKDFGAVGDGVTDDTIALQAALASGVTFLPHGTYRTTINLVPPANSGFVGAGPQSIIKLTGATTDSVIQGTSVAGVYLDNLTLDGDKTTKASASHCLRMDSCTGWTVPRLWAVNGKTWAVGLYNSTGNKFGTVYSQDADTSSGLFFQNGSNDNELTALYAKDCGGFGLQIFESSGNRVGLVVAEDCGLEAVGINYFSNRNQVGEVYSIRSGDNGVSITGTGNQIGTIYADTCDFHGLGFYGSDNIVGTLIARNVGQAGANYAAVSFIPGFGGQASNNTVGAVMCIDDQGVPTTTFVARAVADSHTAWTTATVVAANSFRKNAGNIYWTQLGGTTGATAPTHTSGTVSDGGVLWTYIQPTSTALNNVVNNARFTDNIATPVTGQNGNSFALGLDHIYSNFTFDGQQQLNRQATAWAAAQAIVWGDWRSNGGRVYVCANAGGTTANAPVHTSGTVTGADGIAWRFVQDGSALPVVEMTTEGARVYGGLLIESAESVTFREVLCGDGTPEAIVTGAPGSLYIRSDASAGIEAYVKASGFSTTGWLPFHVRRSGTTASRPVISGSSFTGVTYFDTTLGIPIWYNGTNWVDATGTVV